MVSYSIYIYINMCKHLIKNTSYILTLTNGKLFHIYIYIYIYINMCKHLIFILYILNNLINL